MKSEWNQTYTNITSLQLKIQIEATLEILSISWKVLDILTMKKKFEEKSLSQVKLSVNCHHLVKSTFCQLSFWWSEDEICQ